jgi:methylated-DNA-[protein]-cysteine S-methyltransferase
MNRTHTVTGSPIGEITLVAEDGVLVAVHMEARRDRNPEKYGERVDTGFEDATTQIAEYFAGERKEFDLPLRPQGTEFELKVWEQLLRIPYGETRSYGEVARALGDPGAAQAVGAANGRNPIAIVIPCHRVIGADGSLVGYAGGLKRKRFLLDLEEPEEAKAARLF